MGGKTENPTRMDVEGGAGADQRPRREKTVPFASRGSSGGGGGWLGSASQDHPTAGGGSGPGSSRPRVWLLLSGALASARSLRSHLRWRTPDRQRERGRMTESESKSRKGRERPGEQRAGYSADSRLLGPNNRALSLSSTPVPLPPPQAPTAFITDLTLGQRARRGGEEVKGQPITCQAKPGIELLWGWLGGTQGPMDAHIPPLARGSPEAVEKSGRAARYPKGSGSMAPSKLGGGFWEFAAASEQCPSPPQPLPPSEWEKRPCPQGIWPHRLIIQGWPSQPGLPSAPQSSFPVTQLLSLLPTLLQTQGGGDEATTAPARGFSQHTGHTGPTAPASAGAIVIVIMMGNE